MTQLAGLQPKNVQVRLALFELAVAVRHVEPLLMGLMGLPGVGGLEMVHFWFGPPVQPHS